MGALERPSELRSRVDLNAVLDDNHLAGVVLFDDHLGEVWANLELHLGARCLAKLVLDVRNRIASVPAAQREVNSGQISSLLDRGFRRLVGHSVSPCLWIKRPR